MTQLLAFLWYWVGRLLERKNLHVIAESCYRNAINLSSQGSVESRVRLGRSLVTRKRYAEARPLLEELVKLKPDRAEAWNLLGIARQEMRELTSAQEAFASALSVNPNLIQARNNQGSCYLAGANPLAALECFDAVLSVDPLYYETLNNRVVALLDLGQSAEAEKAAKYALESHPDAAPLHLNLGNAYLQQGNGYLAAQSYRKALELEPGFGEAHFNLALLYGDPQHLVEAIGFLNKEIESRGETVDLLNRLAIAYMASLSFVKSEKTCRKILAMQPEFAPAYITLGNVLSLMGDCQGALDAYQQALDLKPDDFRVRSNLMFELNYLYGWSTREIFEKHLEWARKHEQPLIAKRKQISPEPGPERRLKVGYVSPDFLSHPVGYLIQGIIQHHDKENFEIHCYAHVARPDHLTDEIRQSVDVWHDTTGLNDTALADKVVEDKIDILVDLVGHTAGHRLPLFALRPAPVQVTWLGYFHSTGMEGIDYFITDPYTSPKDGGQYFSEVPVYLPHTRFCYTPPSYAPAVADPPFLKNGFITFGCFNKLAKMSDETVAAWVQILERLPDARLWLKSAALNEEVVCEQVRGRFSSKGISPERILLHPPSGHVDMFNEYGEIDIALDPFPYTGGITSFEALWMGVPVITLAGKSVVARQSVSALANLGLTDLAFETIPQYVEGAIQLAQNKKRLQELRQTLRPVMEHSPLCELAGFTRDLENLYRRMWHAWCEGGKLPSDLKNPLPIEELEQS